MKRVLLLCFATLLLATPAHAAPLPVSGTLDLSDAPATQAAKWVAPEPGGIAGGAVAGIGDFNGDKRPDVAVGEPKRDGMAGRDSGVAYVLLDAGSRGQLGNPNSTIVIRGARAGDFAGFDVAAAGDVNGDGLADLLVGAPFAAGGDETTPPNGEAYLVYGRPDRAEIDLGGDFGGFRITGGDPGSQLGRSVASMPDVNGDSRPELLVGAPLRDVGDRVVAGSAYVVFGRPAGTGDVNVAKLVEDGAGYRIDGPAANPGALAGRALSSIGDLDGDGLPEVLTTAPRAGETTGARTRASGQAYVVRGRATPGVIDLQQLGDQGFVVTGRPTQPDGDDARANAGDWIGESISGVGDVNGDRRPDFIVGAHLADAPDRVRGGVAYVIFGRTDRTTVDVGRLRDDDGFRILGVGADDQTGFSVAPAGDFNVDGVPDIAVSAPFADPLSRDSAGAAYVVYGAHGKGREVDLAEIGARGLRIAGAEGDAAGFSLDAVGDVNGDGGADLAIGSAAIGSQYLFTLESKRPGVASIAFGASGKGDIPGAEITEDPGYRETIRAGCRPATNIQAILDDDSYTENSADPERIRLAGMQAYVGTPRNFGTVLGVSSFGGDSGESQPVIEPTELTARRVDLLKGKLRDSISGEDEFPGYDLMFGTLADDNPSAGARIMVIDGYTFRSIRRMRGLTQGSAPTYIVAIGDPPDRNRIDIQQMKRVTRETKGRYYEARTARQLERALQAVQSRIRCDIESDEYQANLQAGDEEEIAETELEEGMHSADITLTWRDDDEDYEIEEIDILDDEGDDVIREIDEEDIEEAYEEDDDLEDAPVTAARGKTFRSLHVRNLRAGRRLRVTVRSDDRRSSGRVYARITQSRLRR